MSKARKLELQFCASLCFMIFLAVCPGILQAHTRLSDSMIQTLVTHRLEHQKFLHDKNIRVAVEDGVVSLKGSVESIAEKKRAERAALGVDDVSAVQNNLVINTSNRSDQQITVELSTDIRTSVFYDIFDWVEEGVHQGNVTLSGYVHQPWRTEDYERLAEEVAGVKSVTNQIELLPNSDLDDQIRIATARLIYGDPRFIRYAHRPLSPIHIVVSNGNVILKGSVSSLQERQEIESIVRGGIMAFDVIDDLSVDHG